MNKLLAIPQTFTERIAVRDFEVVRAGIISALRVELGHPVQDIETVTGFDWRCPVRFLDSDGQKVRSICGIDSLQALKLACHFIQIELEKKVGIDKVELRYLGDSYDPRLSRFGFDAL
jgi:hypothetical protein